jgi:hypothetical protein
MATGVHPLPEVDSVTLSDEGGVNGSRPTCDDQGKRAFADTLIVARS